MTFVAVAPTLDANFGRLHGHDNQHIDGGAGMFIAHSLRGEGFDASEDGTGRGTPIVPVSFTGGASEYITLEDCAHPVTGRHGDPGMVAFDTTQITSAANYSNPQPGDPCHPLAAGAHVPSIAFALRGREGGAVPEIEGDGSKVGALRSASGGSSRDYIQQAWQVRRLTPTECERLQSFPDGFTNIEYRGKAAADGPRYKALGNSWVMVNGAWIIGRIAERLAA